MITIDFIFGFVSGIIVGCLAVTMLVYTINEMKKGGAICGQMGKNNE